MLDINLSKKDNPIGIPFINIIPIPYTYFQHIAANIASMLSLSSNNLELIFFSAFRVKLIKVIKVVKVIKVIKKGISIKINTLATKGKKVIFILTIISLVKSKYYLSLSNKVITSTFLANISILKYTS